VLIVSASLLCTSSADTLWSLILNPTVAGVDAASWVPVGGNSSAEYDISRGNTNTLSGGTAIASGYARATATGTGEVSFLLNSAVRPGIAIDGAQDELVFAAQNVTSGAETYYAQMSWREPL
jgi:hypothetical protein